MNVFVIAFPFSLSKLHFSTSIWCSLCFNADLLSARTIRFNQPSSTCYRFTKGMRKNS